MKNKDMNLNMGAVGPLAKKYLRQFRRYSAFIFFLLVAALYGFIVWRINVLSNMPPSQSEKTAKVSAQPHIDAATVKKIQSLQDNSVSVQSLFDAARQNPFNE